MLRLSPSPVSVYSCFFLYAFMLGSLFPRLADLQLQMGLGEGALGLALVGLPLGVQLSLLVAGRLLSYLSLRIVMIGGLAMIGLSYVTAAYVATAQLGTAGFFSSLLVAGLSVGIIEVAVNLEADRVEYITSRRIMNRSHAFWSLGFFSTAICGAAASQLAIAAVVHLGAVSLIMVIASIVCFARYHQAPQRPQDSSSPPLFVKPTSAVLLLVCLTLSAMLAEGAAIDWSVIFMRDSFATPPLIGGMALAGAAFFQFATRYGADGFVTRYGPRAVSRGCLWVMLAGVICVVFSPHWAVALIGFGCLGAGSSVIFPLAMSAAAQLKDRSAAVNVASLAQISFVVFLAAPPLLGLIAEHAGIRMSFAVCFPLIVLSFLSLRALPSQTDEM